jgi:hypothetical protein
LIASRARHLGRGYGISDVALEKMCRKMQIRTPGLGYWRRRECGYPASVPKSPPLSDDGVDSVVIHVPFESPSVEVMEGVTSYSEIAAALARMPAGELHPLLAPVNHGLQAARTDERELLVPRPTVFLDALLRFSNVKPR